MGCYMRYIVTDGELSLIELADLLSQVDQRFRLVPHPPPRTSSGELFLGDVLVGEVEANRPGDDLFEDEIQELRDLVDESQEGAEQVNDALEQATGLLSMHCDTRTDRTTAEAAMAPVWQRLHRDRDGLQQIDEAGFFDQHGLVLAAD